MRGKISGGIFFPIMHFEKKVEMSKKWEMGHGSVTMATTLSFPESRVEFHQFI